MLYLSRKIGESIIINNSIELTVVEIRGKSVKLGFDFPAEATVLRKEIHDNIMQENLAAMKAATGEQDLLDADLDFDLGSWLEQEEVADSSEGEGKS
jgi:carbon storage regulator